MTSDLTAVNFGPGDFVRCHLVSQGSTIDGGSTAYLGNRVTGLTNVATLTLSSAGAVAVECWHDKAAATTQQFYVDPGATIVAVSGGPIAGPGMAATASTAVAQSRTTNSVHLGSDYSTVVGRTLPAGTWAVTGNLTVVSSHGPAPEVQCYVEGAGSEGVEASAAPQGHDASRIDVEGVVTVGSEGATVSVICRRFNGDANAYVDPGATVTATRVAASAATFANVDFEAVGTSGARKVVSTTTLGSGTWRIRSSVGISYARVRDLTRCALLANGSPISGGATGEVDPDAPIADVVNSASYTARDTWTLTLACAGDGTGYLTAAGSVVAVRTGAK